jgi:hypothetical protein
MPAGRRKCTVSESPTTHSAGAVSVGTHAFILIPADECDTATSSDDDVTADNDIGVGVEADAEFADFDEDSEAESDAEVNDADERRRAPDVELAASE